MRQTAAWYKRGKLDNPKKELPHNLGASALQDNPSFSKCVVLDDDAAVPVLPTVNNAGPYTPCKRLRHIASNKTCSALQALINMSVHLAQLKRLAPSSVEGAPHTLAAFALGLTRGFKVSR